VAWAPAPAHAADGARVTVLIPTLERYPYLRKLLAGLAAQTLPPSQVLIMDQTPAADRDASLAADFPTLPISHTFLDAAGQCSSRNLGLGRATGHFIFFADDDTEVEPDLLARHVENLCRPGVEASSGVVDEVGAPRTREPTLRASDVFPMGNTMIRRTLLARTGLLDLAFERGARADGDFGMRAHLAGAVMLLDPSISLLVTRASSRTQIEHRHLPARTEIYLARRYFSTRQVEEMLVMRAAGTLSLHGAPLDRARKLAFGLRNWRDTWRKIRATDGEATAMLREFPQIPRLV
jgi:glycosyltransferase involved in cell wall biosynthesis